ncbi:MAG: hypothetical protein JW712_08220 [Dehalococcoidales bacterium]|nr:hypothetical protein [Dehalococcoidales bacterium]
MKRVRITEENAYGSALDRLTGGGQPAQPVAETATKTKTSYQPPEVLSSTMIKLSVFLNRKEDAYLENLSSTAKFSGGKKISKTKLVENMVKAFATTKLDVSGVKSDDELLSRLLAQLRK